MTAVVWLAWAPGLLALPELGASGCATPQPYPQALPPPPSEAVRAEIKGIGLISGGAVTNISLQKPRGRGASAAIGAGEGALVGLQAGAQAGQGGGQSGGGVAIVVAAVAIPVGALVGTCVGYFEGMPAREIAEKEEQLRTAILELDLPQVIARQLAQEIKDKTHYPVVLGESTNLAANLPPPAYASLTNSGANMLCEAKIMAVGLSGERAKSAPLTAELALRVRLVRLEDGAELYQHTWRHKGGARTFSDWAAWHGQALHAELASAVPQLAESIVEEVFLLYAPGQQPVATASRREVP